MTGLDPKVALAQARADAARARLSTTVSALQHKASPQVMAQDVADTIKERGMEAMAVAVDTAKRQPVPVGVGLGLLGLFLARGQIAKLIRRTTASKRES
ncbi:DUF3618 domain-containing protein [Sphingomonas sp. UYEF23]|uniref:DUF3618 domain-containing protein n=1 Tax=Sphingomonas sp. UYEF23 TaxID=1756408 RepID=UPI003392D1C0